MLARSPPKIRCARRPSRHNSRVTLPVTNETNENNGLALVTPKIRPALDPAFRPAVLANRAFRRAAARGPVPVALALERPDGSVSRCATQVCAPEIAQARGNFV